MRRVRSDPHAGFTILELLVGVMLAFVVLILAGGVFVTVGRSFRVGAQKLLAQREATLLSTVISRRIRVASGFEMYTVPDRTVLADSGDGLALLDDAGSLMARLEWNDGLSTLVDSAGSRVSSMAVRNVLFWRETGEPKTIRYRYQVEDGADNLVDIETAATLRN
jgi:Tfp pilus assembly protein PilW